MGNTFSNWWKGLFGKKDSPKEEERYFEEKGWKIPTFEFLQAKRKEYTCPLTNRILNKPTLAYCCKTYFEKDDIEKWVRENNEVCPKCQGKLPLSRLEKEDNFEREDAIAIFEMERRRYLLSERGKKQEQLRNNQKGIEKRSEKHITKYTEEQIEDEIRPNAK